MAVTVLIEGDCVEAEEVAAGVLTISRLWQSEGETALAIRGGSEPWR